MVTTLTLYNKASSAGYWAYRVNLNKVHISGMSLCIKDISDDDAKVLIDDLMQHDIRSERSRDIDGNYILKIFLHLPIECKFA